MKDITHCIKDDLEHFFILFRIYSFNIDTAINGTSSFAKPYFTVRERLKTYNYSPDDPMYTALLNWRTAYADAGLCNILLQRGVEDSVIIEECSRRFDIYKNTMKELLTLLIEEEDETEE